MAKLSITSIQDVQMQTIAKSVDTNNDGILKKEEFNLFAQEATKAGIDYQTISETLGLNGFQRWINDVDKVCTDGKDDGNLGIGETLESFGKGLAGIVKTIAKNPLLTAGTLLVGTGLTALTGGAILPAVIAFGATVGTGMIGVGAYKAATADTDAEAKQAWETIGTGSFTIATSVLGAKSALKQAHKVGVYSGKNVNDMSIIKALVQCFKSSPESIKVGLTNAADALRYNWGSMFSVKAHWQDSNGNAGAVGKKDYEILHKYMLDLRSQQKPNSWTIHRPTETSLEQILYSTKEQGLSTKMQNILKSNIDPKSNILIYENRCYMGFGSDKMSLKFTHFNIDASSQISSTSLNKSAILPVVSATIIKDKIVENSNASRE